MANQGYKSKSAARLAAVQILYSKRMLGISTEESIRDFKENFLGKNTEHDHLHKPNDAFLKGLVEGVSTRNLQIEELIVPNLDDNWSLERIDPVLLNIIKCAVLEFLEFVDVDIPVIISEYLDVTHAFFNKKEAGFVNGILQKIGTAVRH